MTNEEIDELEAGQRLNELVAELVVGEKPPFAYADPTAGGGHGDPGGYRIGARPYSTDIGAAWSVVERLLSLHWALSELSSDEGSRWGVILEKYPREDEIYATAEAETAPLALCRGALKAVNKKEESTNV